MAEITIIGGGVIGLSIARALHKRGAERITVIERGTCGREASWAAAGMLAPNAETEVIDDFYRFCSASNALYPQFAAEILEETGIDIELRQTGTLELAFDETGAEHLGGKYERQIAANIFVERLSSNDVLRLEPAVSEDVVFGLHYPTDGHVENRKLVTALIAYARNNGIEIIENSEVRIENGQWTMDDENRQLKMDNGQFGSTINSPLSTGNSPLTIIITAGAWSSFIKPALSVKPIRGQVLEFDGGKRLLSRVIYGAGAYLVPRADGRILVGATSEDVGFVKEVTETGVRELTDAAVRTVPAMADLKMTDAWSGFRPFAPDGLPVIGELDEMFVATAHYRNGILLAPVTAEIVADKIMNETDSEYFRHFSPKRQSNG